MLPALKRIQVTEPFLPPIEEYFSLLEGVWSRNQLTNQGPLVRQLEQALQDFHALPNSLACVANGGLALQLAIKALGIRGEIITTPFSYVATTSCPLWENCTLRFADIDSDSLTLDPSAVEAVIGPKTEAILGTHVFGNPCDVEALERIAKKHGLALIYDAAHAFGVRFKGRSLFEYGDVSFLSLHATKIMHSVEGGAIVSKSPDVAAKIEWMRRFGHDGPEAFHGVGINAKMSELHAAMGLCVLPYAEGLIARRRELSDLYESLLFPVEDVCHFIRFRSDVTRNYGYVAVLFDSESLLKRVVLALDDEAVVPRRYFYPPLTCLIDEKPESYPVCSNVSSRILCLPSSNSLGSEAVERICSTIVHAIRRESL